MSTAITNHRFEAAILERVQTKLGNAHAYISVGAGSQGSRINVLINGRWYRMTPRALEIMLNEGAI